MSGHDRSNLRKPRIRSGNTWGKIRIDESGNRNKTRVSVPPYLLLTVMTALFHDTHKDDHADTIRHRQYNCNFDEIVFADDTTLESKDTRT